MRRLPSPLPLLHRLPAIALSSLLALTASRIASIDPERPTPTQGLGVRKGSDAALPSEPPAELETLGTLVSLHWDEVLPLSSTEPAIEGFEAIARDRVTGDRTRMAPALLALLRSLVRGDAPVRVEVVSGYRSWKLNEMLRKKGHNVAENSQHSLGHAMDFRLEGTSSKELAKRIEAFGWNGGLAFYPGDTDRFVHADVGPKRRWRGR